MDRRLEQSESRMFKLGATVALSVSILACTTALDQPHALAQPACTESISIDGDYNCPDTDPGFDNPPQHRGTRCSEQTFAEGETAYTGFDSKAGDYYKFGDNRVLFGDPNALASEIIVNNWDQAYKVPVRGVTPTYRWYDSWCVDANGTEQPGSRLGGYVRIVNSTNLVQALFVEVRGRLTAAQLSWPTVSTSHNWQIVKVPLEIRGSVPAPIHASKSASNLTNTLTVTVDATPSSIVFNPGVGGKAGRNNRPVSCPIEWLGAPVPPSDDPSPCSFTYTVSSVNTGSAFTTTTTTVWKITSGDPNFNGFYPAPATKRDLLVAEVQALVTGMGD